MWVIGSVSVVVLLILAVVVTVFYLIPRTKGGIVSPADMSRILREPTSEGEVISKASMRSGTKQSTIEWLREQPLVQDAGLSKDNATIWIKFKSGLEGNIMD